MNITQILGTKYPLIQGGMANIATGAFAAAVSNAGALGLIGAGGMDLEKLRENIHLCRSLTDKPFGVNIMLMHPQADQMAQLVIEEKVPIVTTGAGNPGPYMKAWKRASGCCPWCPAWLWPGAWSSWGPMPSSPKARNPAAMWAS